MTIQQLLRNSKLSPLDAEILLSLAIKKPREYLFAHPEKRLTKSQIIKFKKLVDRRLKNEPIAYLTGKKEFHGLEFKVSKNVLIPRPETELIIELAIQKIQDNKYYMPASVIDVGTGSGNIIVSIAKNISTKVRSRINFYASDISEKALLTAKKNAKRHKVARNIKFVQSDLLKYFLKKRKIKSDNLIITANLPYIFPKEYQLLCKDIKNFEPQKALLSGKKGLGHYIRLIGEIGVLWKSRQFRTITVFLEISPEQKSEFSKVIRKKLPQTKIKFFKDLSGRTRVAKIGMGKKIHQGEIDKNRQKLIYFTY